MSDIFDNLLHKHFPDFETTFGEGFFSSSAYPKVNIVKFDDRIELKAELPGLEKKDIIIKFKDNVLTLSGKKRTESEEENKSGEVIKEEIKTSSFKRQFTIPDIWDGNNIKAKMDGYYLNLIIPKIENVEEDCCINIE
jgi:HSP20 family protein